MSYKTDNFLHISAEDNPAAQTISTTYTEITGSKCEIKSINPSPTLMYKFSFYQMYDYPTLNVQFLHIKLQKSNDNFSSNIIDVPNCNFNISGDTQESNDFSYKTVNCFFIVENFDSKYLRLVARSYSTSYESYLHKSPEYDGVTNSNAHYNPSLIVVEL